MVKPLRLALVVLGLAVALYGVASLTGGWLGEPPWGEVPAQPPLEVPSTISESTVIFGSKARTGAPSGFEPGQTPGDPHSWGTDAAARGPTGEPRPGREWISAGVLVAGLALAAYAVWPRRFHRPTSPAVA